MNHLVIDAGNTRFKIAVFSGEELIRKETLGILSITILEELIATYNPVSSIVSSVVHLDNEIVQFLKLLPNIILLNEYTAIPIKNQYKTPKTLGRDRLANGVAATNLFPGVPALIIDAGTCLKFDFIDQNAVYHGGAISPGLQMRYEALHHFTDMLPLLTPATNADLIGNSTASSIHSGVINGMLAEINGIAEEYGKEHAKLQLILTGGDFRYFLNHIKKPIFADPELTVKGLRFILLYNHLK